MFLALSDRQQPLRCGLELKVRSAPIAAGLSCLLHSEGALSVIAQASVHSCSAGDRLSRVRA